MKKYWFIRFLLKRIAGIWFAFSILSTIVFISFLITGKGKYELSYSKNSTFSIANPLANGYPVRARISIISPADTLLEFSGKSRSGSFRLTQDPLTDSIVTAVVTDTSLKKEYTYSKWVVQPSFHSLNDGVTSYTSDIFDSVILQPNVDIYANVNKNIQFDTEVYFSTDNSWKSFVFGFQYYVSSLLLLLIAYFTYRLMKQINVSNEFLKPLYKNTFTIGVLFMSKIILNLILSFVYTYWYGRIGLRSVPNSFSNKGFSVSFNPTFDFDFNSFLFALVLIVLASLFKYGYELEQDKQMTI